MHAIAVVLAALLLCVIDGVSARVFADPNGCGDFSAVNLGGVTPNCVDVSPTTENFRINSRQLPVVNSTRSVSGRVIALAVAPTSPRRLYAGTFAGVWRSDDGGVNWYQLTWPQPPAGTDDVPGALGARNVFDLAVSPIDENLVLASTAYDLRATPQNGIYRSTDGGISWQLSYQFECSNHDKVGQIVFAPDDPQLVYAAGGCAVAFSIDSGEHWQEVPVAEATDTGTVWHLAAAPGDRPCFFFCSGIRRPVYGVGPNQIWYSPTGGGSWFKDRGQIPKGDFFVPENNKVVSIGTVGDFPAPGGASDDIKSSAHIVAVDPGNPNRIFLAVPGIMNGPAYGWPHGTWCDDIRIRCGGGSVWSGDYSNFSVDQFNTYSTWIRLPDPPAYFGQGTPSGRLYLASHSAEVQLPALGSLVLRYLFFSDSSYVHVLSILADGTLTGWHRLDGEDASQILVHPDPHAIAISSNFFMTLKSTNMSAPFNQNSTLDLCGRTRRDVGVLWMANDGGVYRSSDCGRQWSLASGLATLQVQTGNFTGVAATGLGGPALYVGVPDNDNYFSLDDGLNWGDPLTTPGDDHGWFADPAIPNRVLEFDRGASWSLFQGPGRFAYPNAANESQHREISLPTSSNAADVSFSPPTYRGYKPIVLTRSRQHPLDDGDYVIIRYMPITTSTFKRCILRTTRLSKIQSANDWGDCDQDNSQRKAQQEGLSFGSSANLPEMGNVDVVQVAGGHSSPVFYVGDPTSPMPGLWRWKKGDTNWQQIVPSPATTPPSQAAQHALRFFANPYRPDEITIIDDSAIKVSTDGGATWQVNKSLNGAVSENGSFSFAFREHLLKGLVFNRQDGGVLRAAVGEAGVFLSMDGTSWQRVLSTRALQGQPNTAYLDTRSGRTTIYVGFDGRGILRLGL